MLYIKKTQDIIDASLAMCCVMLFIVNVGPLMVGNKKFS